MPVTAIVTSDYQASIGEIVRASGTLNVVLPLSASSGTVTVQQVGSGTATIVGTIDGNSAGATLTSQWAAMTVTALGGGQWAIIADSAPATQTGTPGVNGGTP